MVKSILSVEMSGNCEKDEGGTNPADGDGDVEFNIRYNSASSPVLLSGYDEVRRIVSDGLMQAFGLSKFLMGEESNVLLLAIALLTASTVSDGLVSGVNGNGPEPGLARQCFRVQFGHSLHMLICCGGVQGRLTPVPSEDWSKVASAISAASADLSAAPRAVSSYSFCSYV